MKKTLCFLLFLFFIVSVRVGAQPGHFQLIGTLKTENDQLIPFKLDINVEAEGKISGISTTNFLNEDKTESKIEGSVDFEKQVLTFVEVENVSTSSDAKESEFCYIRVDNLHWRQSEEKSIFNGQFKGYFPDDSLCASGEIYLVSMNLLRKMFSKNKQLLEIRDSLKLAAQQPKDTANMIRTDPDAPLTHGAILSLPWQSRKVKLQIWDAYEEDNDRIDIYINDSLVHNSIVATAYKKTFQFDLEDDRVFSIKIVAENEGKRPPNTVNAYLIDAGKVHPLITKLKKDEFVEVRLTQSKE